MMLQANDINPIEMILHSLNSDKILPAANNVKTNGNAPSVFSLVALLMQNLAMLSLL